MQLQCWECPAGFGTYQIQHCFLKKKELPQIRRFPCCFSPESKGKNRDRPHPTQGLPGRNPGRGRKESGRSTPGPGPPKVPQSSPRSLKRVRKDQGKAKFWSFSGSDLWTCMLPIFSPPMIWAISLDSCRKPYNLKADDLLGACYTKAMTPPKSYGLYFFPIKSGREKQAKEKVVGPATSGCLGGRLRPNAFSPPSHGVQETEIFLLRGRPRPEVLWKDRLHKHASTDFSFPGLPFGVQSQHCLKPRVLRAQDFHAVLALNCNKSASTLPASQVCENQSPLFGFSTGSWQRREGPRRGDGRRHIGLSSLHFTGGQT